MLSRHCEQDKLITADIQNVVRISPALLVQGTHCSGEQPYLLQCLKIHRPSYGANVVPFVETDTEGRSTCHELTHEELNEIALEILGNMGFSSAVHKSY